MILVGEVTHRRCPLAACLALAFDARRLHGHARRVGDAERGGDGLFARRLDDVLRVAPTCSA